MRRIKMIGLCVVAACAFAALAGASTASAAGAKFNVCVAQKKGNYSDAACEKLAEKKGKPAPGKGTFEKKGAGECYPAKKANYADAACSKLAEKKGKPAPGKGHFEKAPTPSATVKGGAAELKSPAGSIKCTASTGTQQITGPTTLTAATTFTGCAAGGVAPCNSAGKASGEITTYALNGALVSTGSKKAAIHLTGEGKDGLAGPHEGKYLAEFECPAASLAVRVYGGPLGGNLNPVNVVTTTETTEFQAGIEQGLLADFGPPGFVGASENVPSEQIGNVVATSGASEIEAP